MDAFDADVLIYASSATNPLGRRVANLLDLGGETGRGIGSVLLLPELLSKPLRDGEVDEVHTLNGLLARLDLRPVDAAAAMLAVTLGATYGLRAVDATHLAVAVQAGADRFVTNNRRDFPTSIEEIDIVYPDELPDPAA